MFLSWLRSLVPRNLYGRIALILIVPIVTIQIVVSIAFVQRYFLSVTKQMTASLVLEVARIDGLLTASEDAAKGFAQAGAEAAAFDMRLTRVGGDQPVTDPAFYDLSGQALREALTQGLKDAHSVSLLPDGEVALLMRNPKGDYLLTFDRRRTTAKNPHQLLVYIFATGLFMAALSYAFLRNQLRPIRKLGEAAEAFGKGRTVPYRISGATEVRAAGAAFLDMRARIERQIEQRTMMLSGVSHDLRTPLTRLKLGLAMLGDDDEIAELQRDVDDMRRMLDGFLAFARSDATDEPAEEIDPVAIVRAAIEDARRAGADVSLGSVEGQGTMLLRATAVRRALDNLIGNAVSYGTRAEVSVTILERSVRLTVEDDGPGIPEDQRDEAMKPFTRLEPGRNQNKSSGVGLGLAITADIARSHGGSLRLGTSERLGGLKAELVLAR